MTDAELRYLISVNDRDLKDAKRNLDSLHKAIGKDTVKASSDGSRGLDRFATTATRTTGTMTKLAKVGAIAAGGLAIGLAGGALLAGKRMVQLASDAAEVDSKFKITFGRTAPKVTAQLDAFSKATGASRYELKQQAADMGALLRPMIGNTKAAASMSVSTVKLATDLSSFNNIPVADALEKIRAGLVGEAEPLRSVGVLLNEAAVQQEAYRSGIAKHGAQLTDQQKVQARYNLILQQTKLAQGDATRTSGSMANQMRALQNNLHDTATEMGTALIPVALSVVKTFNQNWPTIERVGRAVFGTLLGLGQQVVGWFRANWSTISAVALAVFRALAGAWTGYLQPALRAIGAGISWLAGEARRYWPQIQQAAAAVAQWYRTNLQPTIDAVVGYLRTLWSKYGADVIAVARQAFNTAATIVRVAMTVLKDAIEVVLAVIRGDWGKAWSSLKALLRDALTGALAILKSLGQLLLVEAKLIGKALIDGIIAGVTGAGGLLKDAVMKVVHDALDHLKHGFGIFSPSLKMRLEVGLPLAEGMARGLLDGKTKVTDAMQQIADAAFNRAQSALSTKAGRFGSFVNQAFSLKQGAATTPTERRIAALEDKRQRSELDAAVKQGEAELAKARADAEATPQDVADAQKRLDDARYQAMMYGLQKQAAAERENLEQRQFVEQLNFQQRLVALQTYLESGTATAKGATNQISDLLADFGITAGDMGELAGKLFAAGLRQSIPGVVAAAKDLTTAAANQKVVTQAGLNAQQRAAAAKASRVTSGAKGGAGVGDLPSGSLVQLGRALQAAGFQVGEHPAFGGVAPVHADHSYHYAGRAIDVNWPGGGSTELGKIQAVYNSLRARGGFAELLLEDIGKSNQHLHVALGRGGIVRGGLLGDSGSAALRREAVLPLESGHGRAVLADAFADALERAGGGGPLVHVGQMIVRDNDDVQRVASAVNRAMGIR